MFCTLAAALAILAGGVQIAFLWLGKRALRQPFIQPHEGRKRPVSVIICARNEAKNLRQRLPAILEQHYPHFEVVVIDDGSADDTAAVLAGLHRRYSQLRFRKIQPGEKLFSGKKGALQTGVAEAAHEILLFTDADCLPASPFWIQEMAAALTSEKEIVVGYGPYEKAPGFLNAFTRAETLWSFLQVKAFYHFGVVYMAVGRNLCVRKKTFLRASAHPLWQKTLSGDDDMLMRICATAENVAVIDNPQAFTYSPSQPDWQAYRRQKQRHLSTGKYYRLPVKILLATLHGTQVLCWLLLPLLIFCLLGAWNAFTACALALFLLRTVLFVRLISQSGRQKGEAFPEKFSLLFDAAFALYPLFFAPYIFWKNKDQWN